MRIADSTGLCSRCYMHNPDTTYYDLEVAHDGAPVLDPDTGTIAVSPVTGMVLSHDDLMLCEPCVRELCELAGLKPELHSRQFQEIQRQEAVIQGLRGIIERQQTEIAKLLETRLPERQAPLRGPGRPRKQPVGA